MAGHLFAHTDRMSSQDSQHGNAGLGSMPSMSPECTPMKHKYDTCFNRWFEEYLGVANRSSTSSSSSSRPKSFWSRSSTSEAPYSDSLDQSSTDMPKWSETERKRLRERLDGDCGHLWKDYQSCVLVRNVLPIRLMH